MNTDHLVDQPSLKHSPDALALSCQTCSSDVSSDLLTCICTQPFSDIIRSMQFLLESFVVSDRKIPYLIHDIIIYLLVVTGDGGSVSDMLTGQMILIELGVGWIVG